MAQLGADPEALRDLARSMRGASTRLGEVALGLERRCRTTGWQGRDAERFEQDWRTRHRPALVSLSQRCSRLASELDRQADEQARASTDTHLRAHPGTTAARAGRLEPLPLTEQRYLGGLELTAGFVSAGLRGEVTVQQLGGGRSRVIVERTGAAGLAVGAGASASVGAGRGDPSEVPIGGGQASASGHLGVVERRTWEVADGEVRGLLLRIAADDALDLAAPGAGDTMFGGTAGRVATGLAGAADGVVRWITGVDPGLDDRVERALTIPAPHRTESLVEVEAGAAAAAPAAHLALSGTLRAGGARWPGGRSLIVEQQGSGSATLGGALLRHVGVGSAVDVDGQRSSRIEVVRSDRGGWDHALVTITGTDGSTRSDALVRIDLSGSSGRAAASLAAALERTAAGDVRGGVDSLRSMERLGGSVEVLTSTARIDSAHGSAEGSAGAGPTVRLGASGQVVHLDRRGR